MISTQDSGAFLTERRDTFVFNIGLYCFGVSNLDPGIYSSDPSVQIQFQQHMSCKMRSKTVNVHHYIFKHQGEEKSS